MLTNKTMEKIYKILHFTFVRMDNLSALLPNATTLVGRFFAKMSKKRQNNFSISAKFTNVYGNWKQQLSQNKW
jgi:hypothetical protein